MALTDVGIDPRVAAILESTGIQKLYPPQEEAWGAIKTGKNTVVAIPTASGKSLLAYLAILHRWLATGKKSLYIVPLRALASEKFEELQQFRKDRIEQSAAAWWSKERAGGVGEDHEGGVLVGEAAQVGAVSSGVPGPTERPVLAAVPERPAQSPGV